MIKRHTKMPRIIVAHYVKLVLRSLLLAVATVFYILERVSDFSGWNILLVAAWIVLMAEMILRFFPSSFESPGCQKQFKKNYIPIDQDRKPVNQSWKATALVAAVWLALNGAIGALYFTGVIDRGILILISLAFSVCDLICILYFCPFQTWFMKNRCCTTCRIYNWDFAMMCTPLLLIPGWYEYTLAGVALILLVRWELTYKLHPERFSTATNRCVDCAHCQEKLCRHKPQLRHYLKKNRSRFFAVEKKITIEETVPEHQTVGK